MPEATKSLNKSIMIWVGIITALLSLFFGMQKLYSQWSTQTEAKKEVARLLAVSAMEIEAHDYNLAWNTLEQASQQNEMQDEVTATKEALAMNWLRNIHSNEQVGTFTEQIERILPTLTSAATMAQGQYLADVYAHLGWADNLRSREGNFGLKPELNYRKALAVDPDNTYANTMLAHWLYWKGKDQDQAWGHFETALVSGRDLAFVRGMQFGALRSTSMTHINFLKLINDMYRNHEPVSEEFSIHTLKSNYVGAGFRGRFLDALRNGGTVQSSILPAEDLAIFNRLWQEHSEYLNAYSKYRPYILAMLIEATGDTQAAFKRYTELLAGYPENNPSMYKLDGYLNSAISRTKSN